MSIHYDFYRNPSKKEDKDNAELSYHARVVGSQTIELDEIANHISHRSTLTKGDIQAVISELSDEIAHILCAGNRVAIPEIGYFSLSLSAPKDTQPKQTRAQSLQIKHIEFRAGQQLKNKVMAQATFERTKEKRHSAVLSRSEIDALLTDFFKENKFLTSQKFAELCHFTRITATRHLRRLVEEGCIQNNNTLRNPIYEPVEGYYK